MSPILDAIVAHKREELRALTAALPQADLERACIAAGPTRDFEAALRPPPGGIRLIAEVKRASPSRGVLAPSLDHGALARTYAASGAAAISVLTDERFFGGHLDHLAAIRRLVEVPLLRKDFTLDEYHVLQARAAGADAILLIVSILTPSRLRELMNAAKALGLAALVEVHSRGELEVALGSEAAILGINNRDLRTFHTTLETTLELLPHVPAGPLVVSESGFSTSADVRRVAAAGAHAVLVGEALVRAADARAKTRELALLDPEPAPEPRAGGADAAPGPRGTAW